MNVPGTAMLMGITLMLSILVMTTLVMTTLEANILIRIIPRATIPTDSA